MKVFASWSGGKDCMLALYRFIQTGGDKVSYLINMCDSEGNQSRTHGIKTDLIKSQAEAINIPLIQKPCDLKGYETNFKSVITELKKNGVKAGIFGDIYLVEHKIWIERVCKELDIEPIFPLWGSNTKTILNEFIDTGFKALTVAVNTEKLNESWIGRNLDLSFFNEITAMNNIDPCAENGEYHTFVYDGPSFSKPVQFEKGEIYKRNNLIFLSFNHN